MRIALHTNSVISALLFSGTASRLVPLWQSRPIIVLISRTIFEECLYVLAYPKFRLRNEEIQGLMEEELLPFVETVRVRRRLSVVRRDPDDDKFLECAAAGRAECLVAGDRDLLDLPSYRRVQILTVRNFLEKTEP